jgi:hypothetical protein
MYTLIFEKSASLRLAHRFCRSAQRWHGKPPTAARAPIE